MIVRGAPAIGVSAAYGMYLGAKEIFVTDRNEFLEQLEEVAVMLRKLAQLLSIYFGQLNEC